ncbi:MAG: LacI family DNA-binding transcriptional regulator [Pseudomonadota bacterium]
MGITHRTTLKQLAQHLGLSQTTVSRALNGFPEVSEATRERVRDAAAALDYRASLTATTLATGRTRTVGHVVPVARHGLIDPHFADTLAGASTACQENGYDMLLRMATPEEEQETYRDLQARQRVDGVVLHEPAMDEPRIALLGDIGLPFIVHGRAENEDGYDWLDVDNEAAFRRATEHLIGLGHSRIALINGPERMSFAARRKQGHVTAMAAAGLALETREAEMTEPEGAEATIQLLARDSERPTALLFASVLPALGGIRALREAGLNVPDDMSVMAFDDELSFLRGMRGSGITAMHSSIHDAGHALMAMLIARIDNPDIPQQTRFWPVDLREAGSTAPPPK